MNLRELIQEVAKDGPADPRLVTAEVLSRIAKKDEREALAAALPHMVRQIVIERTTVPIVTQEKQQTFTSQKIGARQDKWEKVKRQPYAIPDGSGGWAYMFLKDMNFDQVVAAAKVRYADAARVTAVGDWLMSVADAVTDAGVTLVGELPSPVLQQLASKQAAA